MRPVRTVRVAHVDIAGVGAAARDHCEWRSTLNLGFAVTARCAQGVTTDAAHAGRFAWSAPGPVELPGRLLARDSSAAEARSIPGYPQRSECFCPSDDLVDQRA